MLDVTDKVVYQIYPKSFRDSNGDGIGDLNGITEKLGYLADLGVDYLWLTPFFVSPQRDNGYDVADYRAIDPRFGTMADLERLVDEARKRGIGLMLDMVFNHTSTEHEWFRLAMAGEQKYRDYYIWRDGAPDAPPTNWASKFGGSAWEYVPQFGQWYLHLFDVSQADLNWENPAVREELKDVLRFWKGKGITGFRFDVVNLISKGGYADDAEGDGRRFYTDGPRVHEYLKELVRDSGIDGMITVGEMSSTSLAQCARYSGRDEHELAMCFHFQHLKVDYRDGDKWSLMPPDLGRLKALFADWQEGMQAARAWDALFWDNHDQPRAVSRFGDEGEHWAASAKMLAGVLHLMRGTPYIYQGDEIGQTNAHFPSLEQYRDVESLNYYGILTRAGHTPGEALRIVGERSRDNGRTPFQWSAEANAGFSTAEPWIPVAGSYTRINAAAQAGDPDSIYAFYRRLIRLRKEHPVIARGTISFIERDAEGVLAYVRELDGRRLAVYANLTALPRPVAAPAGTDKLIGNYGGLPAAESGRWTLRPYEVAAVWV